MRKIVLRTSILKKHLPAGQKFSTGTGPNRARRLPLLVLSLVLPRTPMYSFVLTLYSHVLSLYTHCTPIVVPSYSHVLPSYSGSTEVSFFVHWHQIFSAISTLLSICVSVYCLEFSLCKPNSR